MEVSFAAFGDEVTKIAREAKPVTRERAGRALKGALGIGLGAGLGTAAGAGLARVLDPKIVALGSKGRKAMMVGMGALGAGAGLAKSRLKRRYLDFVEGHEG